MENSSKSLSSLADEIVEMLSNADYNSLPEYISLDEVRLLILAAKNCADPAIRAKATQFEAFLNNQVLPEAYKKK